MRRFLSRFVPSSIEWRIAGAIALSVFFVYACVLGWILHVAQLHGYPANDILAAGDAQGYVSIARTLVSAHRFALAPEALPQVFRTPAYPFFLAVLFALSLPPVIVALAQALLTGCSAALLFLIGSKLFSRGVGLGAAILLALDPSLVLATLTLFSESLFLVVLMLVLYVLCSGELDKWRVLAGGLLVGLLTLVRPIALPIAPLFFLYLLWKQKHSMAGAARAGAIFLIGLCAVVVPWMARNQVLTGHASLSSVSSYNMLFYNVVEFEAQYAHVDKQQFMSQLRSEMHVTDSHLLGETFVYQDAIQAEIWRYIGPHLGQYAYFHLIKTIPFFIGSSFEEVAHGLGSIDVFGPPPPSVNLSGLALSGNIGAVLHDLADHPLFSLERLYWILMCLSAAGYALSAVVRRDPRLPEILLFAALLAAFAVLTGPVSEPRYRIPAEPFLLLLALGGVAGTIRFMRHRLRCPPYAP